MSSGSVDPLADLYPSYNAYAYVFNNPIITTDPTGMAESSKKENETSTTKTDGENIDDIIQAVWDATDEGERSPIIYMNSESNKHEEDDCCIAGMGVGAAQVRSQTASAMDGDYMSNYLALSKQEAEAGLEGIK